MTSPLTTSGSFIAVKTTRLLLCVGVLGIFMVAQSVASAQGEWDEDYSSDGENSDSDVSTEMREDGGEPPTEWDTENAPSDDAQEDDTENDELGSIPGDATADGPAPTEDDGAISVDVAGGVGVGTLRMDLPQGTGHRVLPETAFAAAGVSLAVHIAPKSNLSVRVGLAYQTSLGFKLQLEPLFGLPEQVHVRFQHFEGHVAPVLNIAQTGIYLAVPLGFAFNAFAPLEHQYDLKQLVVGGPFAGLELSTALGSQVDGLIGADLRWLALINSALRDAGSTSSGIGIGVRAALRAHIGSSMYAELAYREFSAFAPASSPRYRQKERFLTVRLGGKL